MTQMDSARNFCWWGRICGVVEEGGGLHEWYLTWNEGGIHVWHHMTFHGTNVYYKKFYFE